MATKSGIYSYNHRITLKQNEIALEKKPKKNFRTHQKVDEADGVGLAAARQLVQDGLPDCLFDVASEQLKFDNLDVDPSLHTPQHGISQWEPPNSPTITEPHRAVDVGRVEHLDDLGVPRLELGHVERQDAVAQ